MGIFTEKSNGDLKESTVIGLAIVLPLFLGAVTWWGLDQLAHDPTFKLPTLPGYQPTSTPSPDIKPAAGALLLAGGLGMRRAMRKR